MRSLVILGALALSVLSACASTRGMGESEKLALYDAHASVPVRSIRYTQAIDWEKIDDQHLLLTLRPREVYLLRVSGPCLDWGGASPTIQISTLTGQLSSGFDRISVPQSPVSCRIEEIRPVDIAAVRASREQMASK